RTPSTSPGSGAEGGGACSSPRLWANQKIVNGVSEQAGSADQLARLRLKDQGEGSVQVIDGIRLVEAQVPQDLDRLLVLVQDLHHQPLQPLLLPGIPGQGPERVGQHLGAAGLGIAQK